jgi:hypothetical protein
MDLKIISKLTPVDPIKIAVKFQWSKLNFFFKMILPSKQTHIHTLLHLSPHKLTPKYPSNHAHSYMKINTH